MQKFKLFYCLTLFLTFTSCSSNSSYSKHDADSLIQEYKYEVTFDFFNYDVSSDGIIYIADKNYIKTIDERGEVSNFTDTLGFCIDIALKNEKIYALDISENSVKVFNKKGKFIEHFNFSDSNAYKLNVINNNIFLLSADTQGKTYITIIDIDKNISEKINTYDNIEKILEYRDDSVLLCLRSRADNTLTLLEYDYVLKTEVSSLNLGNYPGINDVDFDILNDTLYMCDDALIKTWNISNDTRQTFFTLNSDKKKLSRLTLGDYCFAADISNKMIYKINKKFNEKNTQKLSVISDKIGIENDKRVKKAVELLSKEYPYIQLNLSVLDNYREILKTKIMSGDSDYDIFLLSEYDMDYFAKNKATLDLRSYNSITNAFDNMFDGFKELSTYDQRINGVPFSFSSPAWIVNTELLEYLGFDLPDRGWTWDDFYIIAEQCRQFTDDKGNTNVYAYATREKFLYDCFRQYNSAYFDIYNGIADYYKEEFINLLNMVKALHDNELIKISSEGKNENVLFKDSVLGGINMMQENNTYILPPTLKSQKTYWCNLRLLCINKKSPNHELAVNFLDKFLLNEHQNVTSYNHNNPTPRYFDLYKELVRYSKPQKLHLDFNLFLNKQIEEFIDGNISVEQTALAIQKKAEMVIGE